MHTEDVKSFLKALKKKKNLLEFFAHVYFGFMSNNHGKTNITGASKYFKF